MDNLKDNLKRLKELSEQLVMLPQIAHIKGDMATYDMAKGICEGLGLFHVKQIAVQYATMSPDSEMECHAHDGMKEILICYEGDIEVSTKEIHNSFTTIAANVGGLVIIDPYLPHIVKSVEGCKMIAITIPASEGYPPAAINTVNDGK